MKAVWYLLALLILMSACASTEKLNECNSKLLRVQNTLGDCSEKLQGLNQITKELDAQLTECKSKKIAPAQPVTAPAQSASGDVWSKLSGYTIDDCYEVCTAHTTQIQTNMCRNNCAAASELWGDSPNWYLDDQVNMVKLLTGKGVK